MIHLLVGARHRDMVDWCDEHLLHRSEIGRTVFSTAVHEERHLRGRIGPVRFIMGLPSDPRPWSDPLQPWPTRARWMIELAQDINFRHLREGQP